MMNKDLEELRTMADSLANSLAKLPVDPRWAQASLDEIVGESYVKELASMTEAEAVHHLRSSDGVKLFHAYSILSIRPNYALRANHPVLAEVCLKFMASSKVTDRSFGADEIGIWLQGTHDKNASHALALMVINHGEADTVKAAAYSSLEMINNKKTAMESLRRNMEKLDSPEIILREIDWNFVDSFL